MIPMRDIADDYYDFDEKNFCLLSLLALIIGDILHAIEECSGIHALFARKLEFLDIEPLVETCHLQLLLEYTQGTYRGYTTRKLCETRLENLEHLNLGCTLLLSRMSGCLRHFAISILKDDNRRLLLDFGPRTWIRRETTDKIIYLLGWLVEARNSSSTIAILTQQEKIQIER